VAVFTLHGEASPSGGVSTRSLARQLGVPLKVTSSVSRREPQLA